MSQIALGNSMAIIRTTGETFGQKAVDTEISLNEKGFVTDSKQFVLHPTILNFQDGWEYSNSCYVGTKTDVTKLIATLIDAAVNVGDWSATMRSISFDAANTAKVKTIISNGETYQNVTFEFPVCQVHL